MVDIFCYSRIPVTMATETGLCNFANRSPVDRFLVQGSIGTITMVDISCCFRILVTMVTRTGLHNFAN